MVARRHERPRRQPRFFEAAHPMRCAVCGGSARLVSVDVGLDLYECFTCREYSELWRCCGALIPSPAPASYGWRERDICEHCGANRRPAPHVSNPRYSPGIVLHNAYGTAISKGEKVG